MTIPDAQHNRDALVDAVSRLYRRFLESWNRRDATALAALFDARGTVVGFDGSVMNSAQEIAATIGEIFTDHVTMPYIAKVREVRELAPGCALLRAVAGMPRPDQRTQLNPAANAIQALVAVQRDGQWRIAHLHTTPAQFNGRPELSEALSNELQTLLEEVHHNGS
jgi:uncharacterized protein (TIGR02246 family)